MSKDWDLVPLANILTERKESPQIEDLIGGNTPIIEKIRFNDGKIYLREDGKTKTNMILIRPGDLVISGINAAKGAVAIHGANRKNNIAATIHYSSYIVNREEADIKYLWWLLRSKKFKEILLEYLPGGIKTELKAKRFLPVPIPLPPLEEQRRIVAKVEELAGKIEEARSLREQTIKENYTLYDSFAKKIFKTYLPNQITIEKLVGRKNLKNGKSIKVTHQTTEIACLKLSAMRDGLIDCTDSKPIPMTKNEAEPYLVNNQDVFIVRGNGSKHLVGKAGVVRNYVEGTIFPDLFIRVPLNCEKTLPSFFVAWWNNPFMREKIRDVAKTTSGIWKINQGHIASLSIPILPIEEQERIVAYLDRLQSKVDEMKRLREQSLQEIDSLLPSILDKAFKGEL